MPFIIILFDILHLFSTNSSPSGKLCPQYNIRSLDSNFRIYTPPNFISIKVNVQVKPRLSKYYLQVGA